MPDATAFFIRPGDFYLVRVTCRPDGHQKFGFQFGVKADAAQLEYVREILAQLAGSIACMHGNVDLYPTQALDRLPGTVEAYAKRPPERAPEYIGKHRAPSDCECTHTGCSHTDDVYDYSHITDPDA